MNQIAFYFNDFYTDLELYPNEFTFISNFISKFAPFQHSFINMQAILQWAFKKFSCFPNSEPSPPPKEVDFVDIMVDHIKKIHI